MAVLVAALGAALSPAASAQEGDPGATSAPPPNRLLAEIVDSTYFVGPAEFFALDLPAVGPMGGHSVHLFGDVAVLGGKRDIIVRLFRAPDYQRWLKRRGGDEGKPFWTSPRSRSIRLDQPLPAGEPVVLLLDNGYSIRTPKRVRCQLQIQYADASATAPPSGSSPPQEAAPKEGDIVPRSNAEEDVPPPPPPPPDEGSD
jgi:hypothetical protein